MAIGLERMRARTGSVVHDVAAQLIAALALFGIVFGLLLVENPWLNRTDVGGLFINLNLLGYAIPAMLAAALGLMTRPTRPQAYRTVAAVTAVVLALIYLSLQVARFYQGPRLDHRRRSATRRATPIRRCGSPSACCCWSSASSCARSRCGSARPRWCSLTVAKVFLLDMAGLTGVWRALSFIGLGLVLVGIGYLYQRLLFVKKPPAAPAARMSEA